MSATIDYTPISDDVLMDVATINAYFQAVADVLNNKIDLRGDVLAADLVFVNGSIINVPVPTGPGQLVGVI